ncbi:MULTISPECIES: nucleotidyl transferase AbiEii/AbiGii toxin family protein [Pseudomonas]|uniref:Nucleotidyl transferase AbiEii/AbiGii toxin family protein n=1 Tax=Pseudomonas nitroreducens TaxID=46680 RepID=A0A6G6J7S6_PSENT|nr:MULTISPECIES: nucleotidyl transferase AbiEii/AbiGii toxin family protein [Pseudomonas]MDU4255333.1 nucleotidyl transferase AbiEii/AbiGii toxin family protein [Pseudomonas sp.]QIE91476.1 nucleotidyl transferase AbiEii/AbiGii toxin family protein [Pseudomonas nitroreducens]HBO6306573.1 nucleotidyl transferase AbiEii/AbiGii toxin family protein [Pseudomonas aeruginosa]
MNVFNTLQAMLCLVAKALGPDLCQQMTFVGGCTTGLLLTDDYTREQVRSTDDVDLIVHVMGPVGFARLQETLREHGFRVSAEEGDENFPICAMKLGDLRVDFMPDDDSLGFSNRWYKDAMATSTAYDLDQETTINLVSPVYFVATKLEAWKGRGRGDALASRDIEDILNLIDGRPELQDEIQSAVDEVRDYIRQEIGQLLSDGNFEYAVSGQARGDTDREKLLFERLEALAGESH